MSTLERRLQLLLTEEMYEQVAIEARRSGRSANAVIRDAIQTSLNPPDTGWRDGLRTLLEMTEVPESGPAETWEEIKAGIEEDQYGGKPWSRA